MVASWLQTLILAVIGAALPFLGVLSNGGTVSPKIFMWSVITAAVTAGANILRSPMQNPASLIKGNDPNQLTGPH